MVVDQADLLADRRSTLRQIFDFLSVDAFDSQRFDDELYRSDERYTYPPGYARFLYVSVVPLVQWVPGNVRRSLRRSAEKVLLRPLEAPTLDEDLRTRLQELFAGDVERLRSLTGKKFPSWSI